MNPVFESDFNYKRYLQDLKGWKVKGNNAVNSQDVGLEDKRRVNGASGEEYDARKVKVAIFGLGRIGTIHIQKLVGSPRVQLKYCVESCIERANFVQWNLEDKVRVIHAKDADIVYADPEVDAVIVCTPTWTHEEIATKALTSGKAVLCEKPLAHTYEDIEKCYSLAQKSKTPILCAFNRRFDPSFRQIKDRVGAGEVGQVQMIKTCSRDSPLPTVEYLETSGGIYHDCCVHDIDLICWVIKEYPVSVFSTAHAFIPVIAAIDDFDTVAVILQFASGAIGIIDLSRNAVYGYDQRLEVFGPKGMLTSNDIRPTGVVSHSGQGSTAVPICYSFASRYSDAYKLELEHFLDVLQGSVKAMEVKGSQTLAVSRIATACEQSARTGKIVELSWESIDY